MIGHLLGGAAGFVLGAIGAWYLNFELWAHDGETVRKRSPETAKILGFFGRSLLIAMPLFLAAVGAALGPSFMEGTQ